MTAPLLEALVNQSEVRPKFPHPVSVIGCYLGLLDPRSHCWEAKGHVRDQFNDYILPEVADYLRGFFGSKPSKDRITVSIYMVGKSPTTASPTVMFISESSTQRKTARKMIKESGIMSQYVGVKTAHSSRDPGFHQIEQLASDRRSGSRAYAPTIAKTVLFDTSKPFRTFGLPVYIRHSSSIRTATANAVRIGHRFFFQTVYHAFVEVDLAESVNTHHPSETCDDDFEIDSDSDLEFDGQEEDANIEMTSIGSLSPEIWSDSDDSDSEASWSSFPNSGLSTPKIRRIDSVKPLHNTDTSVNLINASTALTNFAVVRPTFMSSTHILPPEESLSQLGELFQWSIDKDWALIEITSEEIMAFLVAQQLAEDTRAFAFDSIASNLQIATDVSTTTASTEELTGVLTGTSSYTRLSNGTSLQEVYTVRFNGPLTNGDCGAAVVDASTGKLYGHIIAGCRTTGSAYILAANQVAADFQALPLGHTTDSSPIETIHPHGQTEVLETRGRQSCLKHPLCVSALGYRKIVMFMACCFIPSLLAVLSILHFYLQSTAGHKRHRHSIKTRQETSVFAFNMVSIEDLVELNDLWRSRPRYELFSGQPHGFALHGCLVRPSGERSDVGPLSQYLPIYLLGATTFAITIYILKQRKNRADTKRSRFPKTLFRYMAVFLYSTTLCLILIPSSLIPFLGLHDATKLAALPFDSVLWTSVAGTYLLPLVTIIVSQVYLWLASRCKTICERRTNVKSGRQALTKAISSYLGVTWPHKRLSIPRNGGEKNHLSFRLAWTSHRFFEIRTCMYARMVTIKSGTLKLPSKLISKLRTGFLGTGSFGTNITPILWIDDFAFYSFYFLSFELSRFYPTDHDVLTILKRWGTMAASVCSPLGLLLPAFALVLAAPRQSLRNDLRPLQYCLIIFYTGSVSIPFYFFRMKWDPERSVANSSKPPSGYADSTLIGSVILIYLYGDLLHKLLFDWSRCAFYLHNKISKVILPDIIDIDPLEIPVDDMAVLSRSPSIPTMTAKRTYHDSRCMACSYTLRSDQIEYPVKTSFRADFLITGAISVLWDTSFHVFAVNDIKAGTMSVLDVNSYFTHPVEWSLGVRLFLTFAAIAWTAFGVKSLMGATYSPVTTTRRWRYGLLGLGLIESTNQYLKHQSMFSSTAGHGMLMLSKILDTLAICLFTLLLPLDVSQHDFPKDFNDLCRLTKVSIAIRLSSLLISKLIFGISENAQDTFTWSSVRSLLQSSSPNTLILIASFVAPITMIALTVKFHWYVHHWGFNSNSQYGVALATLLEMRATNIPATREMFQTLRTVDAEYKCYHMAVDPMQCCFPRLWDPIRDRRRRRALWGALSVLLLQSFCGVNLFAFVLSKFYGAGRSRDISAPAIQSSTEVLAIGINSVYVIFSLRFLYYLCRALWFRLHNLKQQLAALSLAKSDALSIPMDFLVSQRRPRSQESPDRELSLDKDAEQKPPTDPGLVHNRMPIQDDGIDGLGS